MGFPVTPLSWYIPDIKSLGIVKAGEEEGHSGDQLSYRNGFNKSDDVLAKLNNRCSSASPRGSSAR